MAYEPLAPLLPLRSLLTPDHIAHLDRGILDAHQYTDEAVAGVQAGAVSDLALDTAITRAVDDGRIPIPEVPDLTIWETQEGVYNVGDAGQILGLTAGKKLPAAAKNDLATDLADAATGIGKAVADKFALKGEAASSSAEFVASNAVGEYAWNYPMAMYRTTPAPRTYFGATDSAGNLLACYFDHGTGKTRRQVIGTSSVVDDHHIPTPSVPEGAPQLWVWNNHNRDNIVSYRVGDRTGDLETLGPIRTVTAGGNVSYAAIIRNPDDPLEFWMLNRTWPASSPYNWTIRKGTINESTLDVAWGTRLTFITFPTNPTVQGYVTVAPITHTNGDYGFRFASTGNPSSGTFHNILYGTVNLVTGAVESPERTLTANVVTGAGLPLTVDTLDTALTVPAGWSSRTFAVRGDGAPAIAAARWDTSLATPAVEYLHLTRAGEATEGDGLVLPTTGSYARSGTAPTALQNAQSFSIRTVFTPSETIASKSLIWRSGTAGNVVFRLYFLSTGIPRFQLFPNGDTSVAVTADATTALPYTVGQPVGLRVDVDTVADTATYYSSADQSATWAQLGTVKAFSAAASVFVSPEPVQVGTATGGFLGSVDRVQFLSLDGATTLFSEEFTDGAAGWNLSGSSFVDVDTAGGWTEESLGFSGAPFGGPNSPSYVGGLAYPTPGKGDILYRSRESSGTWYVEKVSKASGSWTVRVLDQSTIHKLVRPNPIANQGPLELIYSAFSAYAGYTNFQGDYRGV